MLDPLADEYLQADHDDPALLFTAAYNSFSGPVFGYLRARGVDDPEAVTQDVFLALYPKLETLHGGLEGAKTLLFSIAQAGWWTTTANANGRLTPHLTSRNWIRGVRRRRKSKPSDGPPVWVSRNS